jgi:hypothetical protein
LRSVKLTLSRKPVCPNLGFIPIFLDEGGK